MNLPSLLASVEQEGIPEEQGKGRSKYIVQVGTQFCIRSNGIDQNFGCWPSREKAEAVMAGKSFIEPDVPNNLLASRKKKKISKDSKPKAVGSKSAEGNMHSKDFSPVTELRNRITMFVDQDTGEIDMADVKASGLPKISLKAPSPFKKSESGGSKPSLPKAPHRKPNPQFNAGKIKADAGEPLAGANQSVSMDTKLWFHPPSLKNPDHIPTDSPGEKNDRFLDVTKRNSKDTNEQRMKILKRSSPGPNVPVRTTLISPTLNSYMPMNASALRQGRKRRQFGESGGSFRAYGAAKI